MPTLNWIGKEKVIHHHHDVPFRVLDHSYGFTTENGEQTEETKSGNKIIHGDNLEALKSLLPEYAGRIKCIYIDPPYNTGNEGWVYNDNVNDPKILKWLGEVVGKDGEDFTRHDKWLCMMYPRLKLLHKLLAIDGAIFISIDDNEYAYLKLMCDGIFGRSNFIASLPRITKKAGKTSDLISSNHDTLICYSKSNSIKFNTTEHTDSGFKNEDEHLKSRGKYKLNQTLDYGSIQYSASLDYEIEIDGIIIRPGNATKEEMENRQKLNPKSDFCWRWSKDLYDFGLANGFVVLKKSRNGYRIYTKTYQNATISKDKSTNKYYVEFQERTKSVTSLDFIENQYSNDNSRKELVNVFNSKVFEYSKPSSLIEKLLFYVCDDNSIILDSFAGSGTTAHAVLNLNKQDGGNRKFILVELMDYAETITSERVKRVIKGFSQKEGTGGCFDFYEVGAPIFNKDKYLNEEVGEQKIREYIYYTDTKQHLEREQIPEHKYLLDNYNNTGYYFYYEKDKFTTLSMETLNIVTEQTEQYIIYADHCLLDKSYMQARNIIFKKIPRDIKRF